MDPEIVLIEFIENDNMNEVFLWPIILMVSYILLVHILFYDYINETIIDVMGAIVIMLNIEAYHVEIKRIINETIH
jgi:hypothetical protein